MRRLPMDSHHDSIIPRRKDFDSAAGVLPGGDDDGVGHKDDRLLLEQRTRSAASLPRADADASASRAL